MKTKLPLLFLLISLGLFITAGFAVWERYYDPNRLALFGKNLPQKSQENLSALTPVQIDIPALGLSHQVFPAEVKNNTWPSTKEGVSYLSSSAVAGEGNTVIYGHNWPRILGMLPKIQTGESIKLTTKDGAEIDYIVTDIRTVDPHTISILDPSSEPKLTLYTCTGLFDSKRLVVSAKMQ